MRGEGEGSSMSASFCPICLAFLLKFLNYLQAFIGIFIWLYSLWILCTWNRRSELQEIPFPWFAYILMGVGLLLCLISCTGYLAAGVPDTWFLCTYAALTTMLILFEAALAADLIFNKHWQEVIPHDATGKIRKLREVVGKNVDVFEGGVVFVVGIQVISLLIALILRATVINGSSGYGHGNSDVLKITLLDQEFGSSASSACIDSN